MRKPNRRRFVKRSAVGLATAAFPAWPLQPIPVQRTELRGGDLRAIIRDNSASPGLLSGIDSLWNMRSAPDFDAFDPDERGASAGLNFEHVIGGSADPHNAFSPRKGPFALTPALDGRNATLSRRREDDPWSIAASLRYSLVEPHAIDVDFRCTVDDPGRFGPHGYAVFFFCNYMNDVADPSLHFRGKSAPDAPEGWLAVDAPAGHADWNQGGTYRHVDAEPLPYDADHNFKLNLWSYDWPRFVEPFYFGLAGRKMVLIMMFDRTASPIDEIRFSLFKFKLRRRPRPAWDFQYVLRRLEKGVERGFRARLLWKRFVDAEDCLREFRRWRSELDDNTPARGSG